MPVPHETPRAAAAAPHRRRPTAPLRRPAGLTLACPASRRDSSPPSTRPAWTAVGTGALSGAASEVALRTTRDLVPRSAGGRFAHTTHSGDGPADACDAAGRPARLTGYPPRQADPQEVLLTGSGAWRRFPGPPPHPDLLASWRSWATYTLVQSSGWPSRAPVNRPAVLCCGASLSCALSSGTRRKGAKAVR